MMLSDDMELVRAWLPTVEGNDPHIRVCLPVANVLMELERLQTLEGYINLIIKHCRDGSCKGALRRKLEGMV